MAFLSPNQKSQSTERNTKMWRQTTKFTVVIQQPLYGLTSIKQHPELRTGRFCWSKVLLPTCHLLIASSAFKLGRICYSTPHKCCLHQHTMYSNHSTKTVWQFTEYCNMVIRIITTAVFLCPLNDWVHLTPAINETSDMQLFCNKHFILHKFNIEQQKHTSYYFRHVVLVTSKLVQQCQLNFPNN